MPSNFGVTIFFVGILGASMSASAASVIIDTDVGSDDLMAIGFLLSRPDVQIEALTVSNGLAHVPAGGKNLLRLLELAGRSNIPVYLGRQHPMQGDAAFPDDWRRMSDQLPGVHLPTAKRQVETVPASRFLAQRLRDRSHPVRILALGPLTNVAEAFQQTLDARATLEELVIMGGAIHEKGNLGDGGAFKTSNAFAEWNIFVDPLAADVVFRSGVTIRLVPLDATSRVPIDVAYLKEFEKQARGRLGRFVAEVLESARPHIEGGYYQAWDPLAAVALVEPGALTWSKLAIEISQHPDDLGRTVAMPGHPANANVALNANAAAFKRIFEQAFR
jgi:inosine-uridine nucleoside N-ribohydrolase